MSVQFVNGRSFLGKLIAIVVAVLIPAMSPAAAEPTKERVLKSGKIVVGVHNKAPWGYRDASGKAAGFHPELVVAALGSLGIKDVELVISDFGALIPGLQASRFDAIASGLYITPKRCELVAFANPDLRLTDAVLVKEGNPERISSYEMIAANKEIKFGASRGSVQSKNAMAAGVTEDQISLFQNTEATISALVAGRVDAIAFSAATANKVAMDPNVKGIERAIPFTGLILPDGKEKAGYAAVAFRKEDADLRDLFNEQLTKLRAAGTFDEIMARNDFSKQEKAPADIGYQALCAGDAK
ncbi:ectoine/hydroxyectoine ABC transporter substrate-binding protein EhuB [Pelagibius sp.]|uniref:ectoine/hydroxyectoine ABC transporter substrate-binding protein EhuB n=1 Tax=Pelagibius sp. TaxID=1931238 RepID=UPI003BAEF66D